MTASAQQNVRRTGELLSFPRRWLPAKDGRWIVGPIAGAIVFSGPMIAGYAVLDELALYLFLAILFLSGAFSSSAAAGTAKSSRFQSVHRVVFIAFAAYLLLQPIRGAFNLGDVRALLFALLFDARPA